MSRPDDPWEDAPTTMVHDAPLPVSARRLPKKPFLLEQITGIGAPRQHVLELDELVVGRSLQAAIPIDGNGISRQHVALRRSGPEYTFTDLNSANGVYLNSVKTHSAVLREGDMLQLGDVTFVYHEGS